MPLCGSDLILLTTNLFKRLLTELVYDESYNDCEAKWFGLDIHTKCGGDGRESIEGWLFKGRKQY